MTTFKGASWSLVLIVALSSPRKRMGQGGGRRRGPLIGHGERGEFPAEQTDEEHSNAAESAKREATRHGRHTQAAEARPGPGLPRRAVHRKALHGLQVRR